MTDTQLQEYVAMWKNKSTLASQAASNELENSKNDTQAKITALTTNVSDTLGAGGTNAAQGFGTSFRTSFAGLTNLAKNDASTMGTNVAMGFDEGMQSKMEIVIENTKSAFNRVASMAKSVLGIHSPSKVFAEMGGYSAEGYGNGFNDGMINVNKEIANALPTNIDLGKITGSYTSNIDSNSTSSSAGKMMDYIDGKISAAFGNMKLSANVVLPVIVGTQELGKAIIKCSVEHDGMYNATPKLL